MQQSTATTLILPVALGIIMLGLGLSLTLDDFKRVTKYPKAMTIALVCQMLVLPLLCFFIAKFSGLSPVLCVGLMLAGYPHYYVLHYASFQSFSTTAYAGRDQALL